jgi:hypothetical protein
VVTGREWAGGVLVMAAAGVAFEGLAAEIAGVNADYLAALTLGLPPSTVYVVVDGSGMVVQVEEGEEAELCVFFVFDARVGVAFDGTGNLNSFGTRIFFSFVGHVSMIGQMI